MSKRSLYIAGGVFLLLLAYVLFTQTGDRGFNTLNLPVLPQIKAEKLTKIEITTPAGSVIFEKQPAAWQITSPIAFAADKNKLDSLTRLLGELRITGLTSERPEAAADFGLTTPTASTLRVSGENQQAWELRVGQTDANQTHTYVQLPGDPKVYQVLGDITQQLSRPATEWRSLQIFDFSTDQALRVSIRQSGQPAFEFTKEQETEAKIVADTPQGTTPPAMTTRIVWKNQTDGKALPDPAVNQFLNAFTRLSAARIADNAPASGKPLAVVAVATADKEYALEVIRFLADTRQYLVQRKGEAVLYEIPEYQGKNLLKEAKDFTP
ncbi:MAG: DUF4340 domain-containing protein [candidate division FCPU426 bacterium]